MFPGRPQWSREAAPVQSQFSPNQRSALINTSPSVSWERGVTSAMPMYSTAALERISAGISKMPCGRIPKIASFTGDTAQCAFQGQDNANNAGIQQKDQDTQNAKRKQAKQQDNSQSRAGCVPRSSERKSQYSQCGTPVPEFNTPARPPDWKARTNFIRIAWQPKHIRPPPRQSRGRASSRWRPPVS